VLRRCIPFSHHGLRHLLRFLPDIVGWYKPFPVGAIVTYINQGITMIIIATSDYAILLVRVGVPVSIFIDSVFEEILKPIIKLSLTAIKRDRHAKLPA